MFYSKLVQARPKIVHLTQAIFAESPFNPETFVCSVSQGGRPLL